MKIIEFFMEVFICALAAYLLTRLGAEAWQAGGIMAIFIAIEGIRKALLNKE